MIKKSLYNISWKCEESEYRKDPALSYSTLARFEREGFNNLSKLFEQISTPSLTFGSAVDSIITGGMEEFNDRFMVAEYPKCSDTIKIIVTALFKNLGEKYNNLEDIPNEYIINCATFYKYQLNWKPETRAKVIKEQGAEYYSLLFLSDKKIILSTKEHQDVINSVTALKESKATEWYFQSDNPFENIERLYQLKFKACLEGIEYRVMADEIICNHDTKEIFLIDLKTSSHTEWDFFKSFIEWKYYHQARLYFRVIEYNLKRDEYFKDFKIHDYRFIVVNKHTLTPLVWEYPDTKKYGTLFYGRNQQIVCSDPFDVGKELSYYLSSRPKVPQGIKLNEENNIEEWLNKL